MIAPRLSRMSLRTRIILWSFIPTAVILLAVALVMYFAYQRVAEDLVLGRNKELARLSAGQLGADLTGYVESLDGLARAPELYQGDAQAQAAALKRAASRLIVFDGGTLILDHYGRVAAAEPPRPEIIGQDWSDRAYFRQLVRTMGAVFSDVVDDGPGGTRAVAVAVPILGEQGEFRGTLVGQFRLGATAVSAFYGGIVKLRIDSGGRMYVVDAGGRAIYHTDESAIASDLSGQSAVQAALTRQVGFQRARNGAGRDVIASYAPVPGTPWALVTEEDWNGLLLASGSYAPSLLLLLALGIVAPVLVVNFGVRRITGPIGKLIAAAQEIAGGQFGRQITVHTGDEMEELVTQFNGMSAKLAESYAEIKRREERLSLVMRGTNDGIWDLDLRTNEVYLSPRWKEMLGYMDEDIGPGMEFIAGITHPDDVQRVIAQIEAQGTDPSYRLEMRMRHKDGTYRWFLARGLALRGEDGKPYRVAGSHADITERKQAGLALEQAYATLEQRVEERTHEIERRRRVAEGLREIVTVLNTNRPLGEMLQYVVEQARGVLGSDAASIARLQSKDGPMTIEAACGLDADYVAGIAIPVGGGAEGRAVSLLRPIAVPDTAAALARLFETDKPDEQQRAMITRLIENYHAVLSVPLLVKDEPYGAMTLYYHAGRAFPEDDMRLATSFAQQAALAIENARLREQVERAAVSAERSRLARDLHDAVTQSLYSVTLYAEACARLLEAGRSEAASAHLRELRDTAQEALREMRLLVFELRPLALERSGLVSALQARLEGVEERGGIRARLEVEHGERAERLAQAVQQELYHVAREALNNVLKHAHAQHVRVQLEFLDECTRLSVCDDGSGFEPAGVERRGGIGLQGMHERADRLGATLRVDSAPGSGTTVTIEVPPAVA